MIAVYIGRKIVNRPSEYEVTGPNRHYYYGSFVMFGRCRGSWVSLGLQGCLGQGDGDSIFRPKPMTLSQVCEQCKIFNHLSESSELLPMQSLTVDVPRLLMFN